MANALSATFAHTGRMVALADSDRFAVSSAGLSRAEHDRYYARRDKVNASLLAFYHAQKQREKT